MELFVTVGTGEHSDRYVRQLMEHLGLFEEVAERELSLSHFDGEEASGYDLSLIHI